MPDPCEERELWNRKTWVRQGDTMSPVFLHVAIEGDL